MTPPLVTMPDAWTVTVKVNDSGSDEPDRLISGPGNLAFDERGYAWVTNNVVKAHQTRVISSWYLNPMASRPMAGTARLRSPLTGGGILGAGFGVTVDPRRLRVVRQLRLGHGCDSCIPSLTGNGSVSRFTLIGHAAVSPPEWLSGRPSLERRDSASDADGNIWISSYRQRQRLCVHTR